MLTRYYRCTAIGPVLALCQFVNNCLKINIIRYHFFVLVQQTSRIAIDDMSYKK